jgi:hypothetical protein
MLVALIAALLTWVGVPLLVAVIIGLLVALPLSLMLLPTLRKDLDAALAATGQRRREQKARLRAQLRGEEQAGPAGATGPAQSVSADSDSAAGDSAAGGSAEGCSAESGDGESDRGAERPGEHDQAGGAEHRDEVASPDTTEHPPHR